MRKALQRIVHEVSFYVSYFKGAVDLMREQSAIDIRMRIRADGGADPPIRSVCSRNCSTASRIRILGCIANRDIVLHAYGGGIKRITENHCAYDSLHSVCALCYFRHTKLITL